MDESLGAPMGGCGGADLDLDQIGDAAALPGFISSKIWLYRAVPAVVIILSGIFPGVFAPSGRA